MLLCLICIKPMPNVPLCVCQHLSDIFHTLAYYASMLHNTVIGPLDAPKQNKYLYKKSTSDNFEIPL